MNDLQQLPPPLPEARSERSRWFGLVWAVPLAALTIVVFLGIRGLAQRGIDITVTFPAADGVTVRDTKVIYRGIVAGAVTGVALNEDGKQVDVSIRLTHRAKPALNTNTRFWLIGQKPDIADITSVKAALVGVTIGMSPGTGGEYTDHFIGEAQPPIVAPGTPGTNYVLTRERPGSVRPGSIVYYRGQDAGKVTTVDRDGGQFRIGIFMTEPYDKLVQRDTRFWIASPLRIELGGGGVRANLEHASAILSGGVEMDNDEPEPTTAPAPAGSVFPLYRDRSESIAGPVGPEVGYVLRFGGPGGDLAAGTPVRLLGFRVGVVRSVQLVYDERSGTLRSMARVTLYPQRMQVPTPADTAPDGWRKATDAFVGRLVAQGWHARLAQKPPLVGSLVVDLEPGGGTQAAGANGAGNAAASKAGKGSTAVALAGTSPRTLPRNAPGEPMEIPTLDAGGGIDDLTGQASRILAKIDSLPFEAIGRNVRDATAHLDALVASPELLGSLSHLNGTLTQLDQMLSEVRPQVGPLVQKLNDAAGEVSATASSARAMLSGEGAPQDASLPAAIGQLSEAAQSIRALADYLGRHPEALIRGKAKDRP